MLHGAEQLTVSYFIAIKHTHRGTFIATPTHSHATKEKETAEYTLPNQNHRTPTNPNPSSNDQHSPEPAG
jgi:hypothetical protein